MTEQELITAAIEVRKNAYAVYSNFLVGCALQTAEGNVYTGCNVENSSYGLSICAERNAIGKLIAAGERHIERIVVAASPLASPCGACRQFIVEFGADIEVISVNAEHPAEIHRWTIGELLPQYFRFKH